MQAPAGSLMLPPSPRPPSFSAAALASAMTFVVPKTIHRNKNNKNNENNKNNKNNK